MAGPQPKIDALRGVLRTERIVPVPRSIGPEAQAVLDTMATSTREKETLPPVADKQGWRRFIEKQNDFIATTMMRPRTANLAVRLETRELAGVPVYVADPDFIPEKNRDKAIVHFHGGGLVVMGGECTTYPAMLEADRTRCRVYAPDFRNPPDHPYPAALNDCVTVYRKLLEIYPASRLAITGASGGGNLAAAVPLKLRDLGVAMPAAVGLFTPEVDLTESGDSFQTNRDIDLVLPEGLPLYNALYADGHDLSHPLLSPIFADFTKGFPPTFIQAGTRDLFLSNAVRMHRALRRAGIKAELHIGEAMPHGGFGGDTPEDRDLAAEFRAFLAKIGNWAAD